MRAPTTPEHSLAVAGLKVLEADAHSRYKAAVAAGKQMGWGFFFPYLLAQNKPGRSAILFSEDEGSICLFRSTVKAARPRLDLYTLPVPLSIPALRRCLERANDFNADHSARVLRIDAKDAEALAGVPELTTVVRRKQYIYEPGAYKELAGKSFATIRRQLSRVEKRKGVEVAPFSTEHLDGCKALLKGWSRTYRKAKGSGGAVRLSRRALELAEKLPAGELVGEVVLYRGRVVAYALGGEIRPGLACSFERKADNRMRGLPYFQLRSFLLSLRSFEKVNDGSDAGRKGLRQIKNSFRPVEMHTEYRATQKDAG